jgi:hypothetical protein
MNRQGLIEAICYENFVLKSRYNELINHIAKLETDITNLKQTNLNSDSENPTIVIQSLKEINEHLTNQITNKNREISELIKKPMIVVENQSTSSMPLFQLSKYCSSVNNFSPMNDKTDTISELTM